MAHFFCYMHISFVIKSIYCIKNNLLMGENRKYLKLPRIDSVFDNKEIAINSIKEYVIDNVLFFHDGESILVRFKNEYNEIVSKNNEYVKKRKSYYGFARNYPGKLGSSKYVIGESKIVRRNETIRKIAIAIIVILLFLASYVITTVGFNISNKEIQNKTTAVSVTDTAVVL